MKNPIIMKQVFNKMNLENELPKDDVHASKQLQTQKKAQTEQLLKQKGLDNFKNEIKNLEVKNKAANLENENSIVTSIVAENIKTSAMDVIANNNVINVIKPVQVQKNSENGVVIENPTIKTEPPTRLQELVEQLVEKPTIDENEATDKTAGTANLSNKKWQLDTPEQIHKPSINESIELAIKTPELPKLELPISRQDEQELPKFTTKVPQNISKIDSNQEIRIPVSPEVKSELPLSEIKPAEPEADVVLPEAKQDLPKIDIAFPNVKPELPKIDTILPEAKHELPKIDNVLPEIKPELPLYEVKPAEPKADVVLPEVKQDLPKIDIAFPNIKPELPKIDTILPEAKHELPKIDNVLPEIKPELPLYEVKPAEPEASVVLPKVKPELPFEQNSEPPKAATLQPQIKSEIKIESTPQINIDEQLPSIKKEVSPITIEKIIENATQNEKPAQIEKIIETIKQSPNKNETIIEEIQQKNTQNPAPILKADSTIKFETKIEKVIERNISQNLQPIEVKIEKIIEHQTRTNSTQPQVQTVHTTKTIEAKVQNKPIKIEEQDAVFFSQLVNGAAMMAKGQEITQVPTANDNKVTPEPVKISTALMNLIEDAYKANKPLRIDFDKNLSVIIRMDSKGKISAEFLPGDRAMEEFLRKNIPLLQERFNQQELEYNELNYKRRNQQQNNKENNQNKEGKNE